MIIKALIMTTHALVGWGLCGAIIGIGRKVTSMRITLIVHSPFDLGFNSIYKMTDSNFAAHMIQGKSSATKTRRHKKRNMKFRNRSQVQGSTFRVKDKQGINDPKPSLKMLIFPNCQFGSKFWMRSDEVDACLVNTHPKFSPETRMEPLAQTWHAKMWWWKPNHIEYESNFRDTSRRTRAGLNP